jgi:hypothetical protein
MPGQNALAHNLVPTFLLRTIDSIFEEGKNLFYLEPKEDFKNFILFSKYGWNYYDNLIMKPMGALMAGMSTYQIQRPFMKVISTTALIIGLSTIMAACSPPSGQSPGQQPIQTNSSNILKFPDQCEINLDTAIGKGTRIIDSGGSFRIDSSYSNLDPKTISIERTVSFGGSTFYVVHSFGVQNTSNPLSYWTNLNSDYLNIRLIDANTIWHKEVPCAGSPTYSVPLSTAQTMITIMKNAALQTAMPFNPATIVAPTSLPFDNVLKLYSPTDYQLPSCDISPIVLDKVGFLPLSFKYELLEAGSYNSDLMNVIFKLAHPGTKNIFATLEIRLGTFNNQMIYTPLVDIPYHGIILSKGVSLIKQCPPP